MRTLIKPTATELRDMLDWLDGKGAGWPERFPMVWGQVAAALPMLGTIMSVASAGMTILGAISSSNGMQQQASAQERAGQVAVQNAESVRVQREAQAKQLEAEALQNRAAANDEAAKAQRVAIEAKRKGRLLAGKAQAVMAASGAGVDDSMTAGLLAEGDYAGDVALFEGDQRARSFKNAAHVNDYQAAGQRYQGDAGIWQAKQTKAAYDNAAGSTRGAANARLIGGIASAGVSMATYYGGSDWGKPEIGDQAAARAVDRYGAVIYDDVTGFNSVT